MYSGSYVNAQLAASKRVQIPSGFVAKNFVPVTQMNWKRLYSTVATTGVPLYEIKKSTKFMYQVVGLTALSQLVISGYFGPLLITKADQIGDPNHTTSKKIIGLGIIFYGIAINVAFNIFRKRIALKVDMVNDQVKVGFMNIWTGTKTQEFPVTSMIYKKQLPIGEAPFYTLAFRNQFNKDKTVRYFLDRQGNYPNKHILENLEQRAMNNTQ